MTGKRKPEVIHPNNTPSADSNKRQKFGGNAASSPSGAPSSSSGSSSSTSSGTVNNQPMPQGNKINTIEGLPSDVLKIISICAGTSNHAFEYYVSKDSRVRNQEHNENVRKLRALMQLVVHGNEKEAKKLIESDPSLLNKKLPANSKVKDYSGKEIHSLTPLQAALCAGDVEMAEMMKEFIIGLPGGQAELEGQFDEIFPATDDLNGVEAKEQKQIKEVFDFKAIFDAIDNASDADVTKELANINYKSANDALKADLKAKTTTDLQLALAKFRQAFDAKSKSEKIFNPHHLLASFKYLRDNWNGLGRYNWHGKHDLFWRQVIGYVQRHLPACYLQDFAQGIYYIDKYNEASRRSLEFRLDQGHFMRADDISVGLGFRCAGCPRGALAEWDFQCHCHAFKYYVSQKNQAWKDYQFEGQQLPQSRPS